MSGTLLLLNFNGRLPVVEFLRDAKPSHSDGAGRAEVAFPVLSATVTMVVLTVRIFAMTFKLVGSSATRRYARGSDMHRECKRRLG